MSEEAGFSLVELILFTIILLLLLVGVMGMLTSAFSSSAATYNISKLEDAAREALSTMVRQLRVATHVDANSNANTITFTGDLDGNGSSETVTYAVAGGYLLRNGQQWVQYVNSLSFVYYQQASTTPLVPGSSGWNLLIKSISLDIGLSRSANEIDTSRSFEGSVALRNALN